MVRITLSAQQEAGEQSARVDRETPTFTNPTAITNPLFPVVGRSQTVQFGSEAGHPLRIEITPLPATLSIDWDGRIVRTLASQFVAYRDGRVLEVATDYFAQADDGSVWYLGEDVDNYEDGVIANHDGTWRAGRDGPGGMIMPPSPQVGEVYRPESIPGLVLEEVTVRSVTETVDGPRGPVTGSVVVEEHLMDGSIEDKIFTPGTESSVRTSSRRRSSSRSPWRRPSTRCPAVCRISSWRCPRVPRPSSPWPPTVTRR